MNLKLLVVGGSARAAAWSTRRAGYAPLAADRFADRDLVLLCQTTLVRPYPGGLMHVLNNSAADAWLYTGALENRPSLVDRLARCRPLLGSPGHALRAVRDPVRLSETLGSAGIQHPAVRLDGAGLPRNGSWLRKPLRSGGGAGIQPVVADEPAAAGEDCYYQERIDGEPGSAVFVGGTDHAWLVGCSRQLLGHPWNAPGQFVYAGSIAPIVLDRDEMACLQALGDTLVRRCGLPGLFGVDFVRSAGGVWPVEVNPRYTASVELLERSLAVSLVSRHVDGCRSGDVPSSAPPAGELICGKLIVYAPRRLTVPAAFEEFAGQLNDDPNWPAIADLPQAATTIERGQPVVTLLAAATTAEEVERQLRERMGAVWKVLDAGYTET